MVQIDNLSYGYDTKRILNGLNLKLKKNEIHGILGKNGCGKTTLFNLLYKTLKPDEGSIRYNHKPTFDGLIAYLETENYFYPYMKGKEYIRLVAGPSVYIHEWNDLFELPLDEYIENYSTGMKKKLALMAVLTLDRPILILDEPFNGVDLETSERIYMLLETLKGQKTILLSSHIMDSLTRCCDTISLLQNGKIDKMYSTNEFDQLKNHFQVGLKSYSKRIRKLFNR